MSQDNALAPPSMELQVVNDFRLANRETLPPHLIARNLSRIHRYAGAGAFPLSVAQHCALLANEMSNQRLARALLFHDVSEMFIGDIPVGTKRLFPAIEQHENLILAHIGKIYGIPFEDFDAIRPWDTAIRQDEMIALGFRTEPTGPRLGLSINPMSERSAATLWLGQFNRLFPDFRQENNDADRVAYAA